MYDTKAKKLATTGNCRLSWLVANLIYLALGDYADSLLKCEIPHRPDVEIWR